MPLESHVRIVDALTSRGYNAEREAVTLLASAEDPQRALDRVLEAASDDTVVISAGAVRAVLDTEAIVPDRDDPPISGGNDDEQSRPDGVAAPVETKGVSGPAAGDGGTDEAMAGGGETVIPSDAETGTDTETASDGTTGTDTETASDGTTGTDTRTASDGTTGAGARIGADARPASETGGVATRVSRDPAARSVSITGDVTGRSTGTGEYRDFLSVFRDRLERLGRSLRGRINHRPAAAIPDLPGGQDVAMVGLVNDIRSTRNGHTLVELEDASGAFPWLVVKDRDIAPLTRELLYDEVVAMEGTLADDAGIAFVDEIHFPDVPRTFDPSTADRPVQAALVSDVHVGSQEFLADAWEAFASWLHTEDAERVEYLVIAGDLVEGVGVYPDQDDELDVIDIYEQYEVFSEHLKSVPGDLEIVAIPGNHDAVRLAEPQPGFDEDLEEILSAHDLRIASNPSTVTLEGVSILVYHGASLDEVIAELPDELASYEEPHLAMQQLLKKRHVAPPYGGKNRLAPEERDYLVIDDIPDVFHAGHVHKLGVGRYRDVLTVNSGCWQAQTDFQRSVNLTPDVGYAPILDLDTLSVTIQSFA